MRVSLSGNRSRAWATGSSRQRPSRKATLSSSTPASASRRRRRTRCPHATSSRSTESGRSTARRAPIPRATSIIHVSRTARGISATAVSSSMPHATSRRAKSSPLITEMNISTNSSSRSAANARGARAPAYFGKQGRVRPRCVLSHSGAQGVEDDRYVDDLLRECSRHRRDEAERRKEHPDG